MGELELGLFGLLEEVDWKWWTNLKNVF